MNRIPFKVAAVTLVSLGIGAVSQAAPSFHSLLKSAVKAVQENVDDQPKPYQWMLPSVIQAGLVQKEVSFYAGGAYATFEGRSFQMTTEQATIGVTDWLQLLYGEQYVLAKGRSSTSRFDVSDNYYGIKAVVKRPTAADSSALSLQFEAIRPDTGSAQISGSSETFSGTHNNLFAANYLDRKANQYQLQYTNVDVPGGLYAHVVSAGFGHDYELGEFLLARVQGSLVGESFQAISESSNFELRPVLYGCLALNPAPWLALEADITAFPAGIPLAGGEFTAISSFDLYSPGGIVDDLRQDFVAFASLRLMIHSKF